jgi:hypothetical protein
MVWTADTSCEVHRVSDGEITLYVGDASPRGSAEQIRDMLNTEPVAQTATLGDFTVSFREGDMEVTCTAPTLEGVKALSEWIENYESSAEGPVEVMLNSFGGLDMTQADPVSERSTRFSPAFAAPYGTDSNVARLEDLEDAIRHRNEEIERLQADNTALRNQVNLEQMLTANATLQRDDWRALANRLSDESPPALPLMRAAVRTLLHSPRHTRMEFVFSSLDEMYAADKEWVELVKWVGAQ